EIQNGKFSKEMEGGTLTVASPSNLSPSPNFPVITKPYTTKIQKVLNENSAYVSTPYNVNYVNSPNVHIYQQFDYSSYNIMYNATPEYVPTENSKSFAYINVSNLDPSTGDVSRIKVFLNSEGTVSTWEEINDIEVINTNLLVDT